jgi:hypothetical protein
MGVTALAIQPGIDASNKKVDERTRKLSVCRTVSKILVGMTVGILVRGGVYKIVNKMTQLNGTSKFSKSLLANEFIQDFIKNSGNLKTYTSVVSYIIAFAAMCVTNFAIDAPLTALLTNKLQSKVLEKEARVKEKEEALYA